MMKSSLCCLCLILLTSQKCSAVDLPHYDWSESVTGETYVFVGSDLTLTCTLPAKKLPYVTAHNISFGFSDPQKISEVKCLPASSVHVMNNEQATLIVHNMTVNDSGQYNCYVGDGNCPQIEGSLVGFSDDVNVEYPPQNVTNFQCIVFNWNELMICTWQHPVEYVKWSEINVTSGYTVISDKPVEALRCLSPSNTGCKFNIGTFNFGENYLMEVNVTNVPTDTTASTIFLVTTSKSVKPSPVEELTSVVDANMPGCFILSWKHPKKWWEKIYRIQHKNVGEHPFNLLLDNLTNTSYKACGYHPHTHHNFSVECYPSQYSGYWSDPVFTDGWTPMTAPSVGPITTNGSYTTTKCIAGLRNVTVMWQELEISARNGIIDRYFIKQGDTILKNVTSDVYQTTLELSCSASTIFIFAHNKGGLSLEPSILLIAPSSLSVPRSIRDLFNAEILKQKDSVRVWWNVSSDEEIMNYTIFWCLGLSGQTCEGEMSWSKVPGTQRNYIISLSSIDARKYLFGISVTYSQPEMASEIFWTGCLFTRHPSEVKKADWMYVYPGVESVKIMWSPVTCSYEDQVKVTQYIIKSCQEQYCNDTNMTDHIEVPATESSHTLSQLTASIKYKFTLQAVSYETIGPEFSPWKDALPLAPESRNLFWLYVLLIIPVAALIIFASRKCIAGQRKVLHLRGREVIDFENVRQYIPEDSSHHLPRAISEENLMDPTAVNAADQCQASRNLVNIIKDRETTDQENNVCSSGESFSGDQNNSRALLIKHSSRKDGKSSPPACASVVNGTSFKQSSEVYENRFDTSSDCVVTHLSGASRQCMSTEDQAVAETCDLLQLELVAVDQELTCSESMAHYSVIAETSFPDTPRDRIKARSGPQNSKIIPHSHNIVYRASSSQQENLTRSANTEDIANVAQEEDQRMMETLKVDSRDTVAAVKPTTSSVLGHDSQNIEATCSENTKTSTDLPPDPHISPNGAGGSKDSESQNNTGDSQNSNPDYIDNTLM